MGAFSIEPRCRRVCGRSAEQSNMEVSLVARGMTRSGGDRYQYAQAKVAAVASRLFEPHRHRACERDHIWGLGWPSGRSVRSRLASNQNRRSGE